MEVLNIKMNICSSTKNFPLLVRALLNKKNRNPTQIITGKWKYVGLLSPWNPAGKESVEDGMLRNKT